MINYPYNARKDFLTNCFSREELNSILDQMRVDYHLQKTPFSVFIIDVDHFKLFNDKYGHLCGDEVLKYFSSSIRLDLESEENVPFRFGGDEFVVVFPGKTADETRRLAERLKKNIRARPFLYKGHRLKMSFSGGIASYPEDGDTVEKLLENADTALYASKKYGRARITKYQDLQLEKMATIVMVAVALGVAALWVYAFKDSLVDSFKFLKNTKEVKTISEFFSKKTVVLPKPPSSLEKVIQDLSASVKNIGAQSPPVILPPNPVSTNPPIIQSQTFDTVYLKSGGVIRGIIVSENDTELKIEFKLNEGKGFMVVEKSNVDKIEKK